MTLLQDTGLVHLAVLGVTAGTAMLRDGVLVEQGSVADVELALRCSILREPVTPKLVCDLLLSSIQRGGYCSGYCCNSRLPQSCSGCADHAPFYVLVRLLVQGTTAVAELRYNRLEILASMRQE